MRKKNENSRYGMGKTPNTVMRLDERYKALARSVAQQAGKKPTVTAGIKILLEKYGASVAAK